MDVNAIQAELRKKRLEFTQLQEQVQRAKREVRRSQRRRGLHSAAHQSSDRDQVEPSRPHSKAAISSGATYGSTSPAPHIDAQQHVREGESTCSLAGHEVPRRDALSLEEGGARGLGVGQVVRSLGEGVCEEMKGEGAWDAEEVEEGEKAGGRGGSEDMEGGAEGGDEGKERRGHFVPCFKSESNTTCVVQSKPGLCSAAPPCLIAARAHSSTAAKLSLSHEEAESSTGDVATGNEGNPVGGPNTSPPMPPLTSSQRCKPFLTPGPLSGEGRGSGTIPSSESEECDSSAQMASSPSSQSFPDRSPPQCSGGSMGESVCAFGLFSHPPIWLANCSQPTTSDFFLPDISFGQLKLQKLQSRHPSGNLSYGKRKPWTTSTPATMVTMGETRPGSSQCEVETAVCPPSTFPLSPLSGTVGSAPPTAGLGHMGDTLITHPPDSGTLSQGSQQECRLTCSLTKMERGRVLEASADLWSACHFNQTNVSRPPLKEGSLLTVLDLSKRAHLLLSYTTGFCLLSFLLGDCADHLQSHWRKCEETEALTATSLAASGSGGKGPPTILVAAAGWLLTSQVRLYMFTTGGSTCLELVPKSGFGIKEPRNASQDFGECTALSLHTHSHRPHSASLGVAVSMATENPSVSNAQLHSWTVTKKGNGWEVESCARLPLPDHLSHSTGISSLEWVQGEAGERDILLGIGQGTVIMWRAARGEIVKTVNLSCSASEGILGLQLKALQAAQEEGMMFLVLGCEGKGGALEGRGAGESSCWMLALGGATGNHGNHFQLVQSYSHATLPPGPIHYCPGCHGDRDYTISAISGNVALIWQLSSPQPVLKFTFADGTSLHSVTWLGSRNELFALDSAGTLHHFMFAH